MPLLKRKRFPLLPPPPYDPEKKESRDRQVWYSPITAEIFTDYPTYLERTALYKQPIWQSEATGRSNLTYKQALENERIEKERVQDKIPEELQRRVLAHAQFHTGRLDAVVDSVYNHFTQRFCPGEIVNCRWDDGIMYNARILKIIDGSDEDHATVPTTNGETNSVSTVTNGNAKPTIYVVQLIDENSEGLEDFTKTVTRDEIKRDRLAFSKNLLKKFIRENMSKDSYNHAPWIIKPAVAKKFGLDTELPPALEAAKEFAFSNKQKKKTNNTSRKTIEAKMFDAAKLEASLKYPMEDLDLPMYRRDPSGAGPVIDMAPGRPKANATVPNPTGGLPPRPKPTDALTVPAECFGSFLMIWSFLTTFSRPLGLSPFSLDDFENALRHDDVHFKSQLLIESNVCLLNAIIRERQKMTKSQSVISLTGTFGSHVSSYHQASPSPTPGLSRQSSTAPSSEEEPQVMDIDVNNNSMEQSRRASLLERGCGSDEIVKIGRGWDAKAIPPGNDRVGWEDIMIGCINDIASPEMTAELDRIFNQLVPHNDSTLEEREAAYLGLGFRDKVTLMEILTNAANECSIIKEYMEECQEQLTELRKQKIELSRERKRIYAEREELERREGGGGSTPTPGSNRDTPVSESDALSDTEDTTEREEEIDESTNRRESRRATLKRKQAEREEREAKRLKRYHQQREEARLRNQEQKMRNAMRKRLDEEERHLHKKEEQLEHNMRKFSTLRIKPLGRDKFFNRYIYMDNIGGAAAHGTGKLFVQSPSEADLMVLRERNDPSSIDNNNPSPCGHGGGTKFVCELMAAQGMAESACEFLRRHLDPQPNDTRPCPTEWWEAYQDPEDLDKLLDWLNPKGIREYRLRKEIEKQKHNMITGMRKKVSESHNNTARSEMPRRSTRSKTVMAPPVGSWLAYTNKLAR